MILAPPKSAAKWAAIYLVIPNLVGVLLTIASDRSVSIWLLVMVELAICALIVGAVTLVVGAARRRRTRLLADAPAGSLFVGEANAYRPRPVEGSAPAAFVSILTGRFVIDAEGISFGPVRPYGGPPESNVGWSAMSRLTLKQPTPFFSRIEVIVGPQVLGWQVGNPGDLYVALADVARTSPPPGPSIGGAE